MGRSDVQTAVFIETNLGTRLAVPASPDITAEDFKREVERTHLNCFPEFGNIRVKAVMVKQNLHCYHLSGSFPLKYAFLGSNVTWFLQTRVHLSNTHNHVDAQVHNLHSAPNVIAENEMLCQFATGAEVNTNVVAEAIGESISVSGIIKKYFSDYDEVASSSEFFSTTARYRYKKQLNRSTEYEYLNVHSHKMSPVTRHIIPQDVWLEKPSSEHRKPDVGKRLLLASDSLRLTPSNRRSILSLCRYNDGESHVHKFPATVRNLVFNMADEGD